MIIRYAMTVASFNGNNVCLFLLLLLLLPTLLTERCLIALQIDRGTTLKRCSGVRISTR